MIDSRLVQSAVVTRDGDKYKMTIMMDGYSIEVYYDDLADAEADIEMMDHH
jgi:hypothetical protein